MDQDGGFPRYGPPRESSAVFVFILQPVTDAFYCSCIFFCINMCDAFLGMLSSQRESLRMDF